MSLDKIPKSLLFMPAFKTGIHEKAAEVGASVGVIDLEDGTPANKRDEARLIALNFLNKKHSNLTAIRINSIRTKDGLEDMLLLLGSLKVPDIIILPMVDSREEVVIVKSLLFSKFKAQIYCIIETPTGISNVNEIAEVSDGIIFGAADFTAKIGVDITWESTLYARHTIINAAAKAGIPAIDTPCFNLSDNEVLKAECQQVRRMGYNGKCAVHPNQIKIINEIFTPSQQQIHHAKAIIEQFNQAGGSISKVNDMMIGPPFITLAKKILLQA